MESFGHLLKVFSVWGLVLMHSAHAAGPHDGIPGHSSDLPIQGRSNFDHLVHRLDGKLPFPFDNLIDQLQDRDNIDVVRTLFPHGRSLQRNLTDFDAPRDLITVRPLSIDPIKSPKELFEYLPQSDLYIGYSPQANTLEVISMNRTLGRYEFQIVHDYGPGLTPKIGYAPRALCESCHQGGGPIFSIGSWSESERGKDHFERLKAGKYVHESPSRLGTDVNRHGISKAKWAIGGGAPGYDAVAQPTTSMGGNFQELWVRGCGSHPEKGRECRRILLELMFDANVHSGPYTEKRQLANITRLKELLAESWPKEGINFYSAHLNNRDVEKHPAHQPLPAELDPLTPRAPRTVLFSQLERDFTSILNPNPNLSIGSFITTGFCDYIGERESRYLYALAGSDPAKFSALLKSNRVGSSFDYKPLDRDVLFKNILQELGVSVPAVLPRDVAEKQMPPPVLETNFEGTDAKPLMEKVFSKTSHHSSLKTLGHFKKYCGGCHEAGALPFGFMKGSDEEILAQLRDPETFAKISERLQPGLDQRMMPPPNSRQGKEFRREASIGKEMTEDLAAFFKNNGCNVPWVLKRKLH